jgi:hypothetical protein
MPIGDFDEAKWDLPKAWANLMAKRARRLQFFLQNGNVHEGWTPPESEHELSRRGVDV